MELNLGLHKNQIKIFNSPARGNVIVCGRGFGKSRFILTRAIYSCLSYRGNIDLASPKVVMIACPYMVQARSIFWVPLLSLLENSPVVANIDKTNHRITFKGKNTLDLVVRGADDHGDKIRGFNIVEFLGDEYQDFAPDVWEKVISPALARNHDWSAYLSGTPKGEQNILYKAFQMQNSSSAWRSFNFRSKDNPFFPRKTLREAKLILPPKVYEQEHGASFLNFDAQWFPSLLEDHIVDTIPSRFREIFLGADWGDKNPALSVVGVTHDSVFYLLDKYEPREGLIVTEEELIQEAIKLCNQWNIRKAFLPDDRPAMVISFRRAGNKHDVAGLKRAVQIQRNQPGLTESLMTLDSLFYQNRLYIRKSLGVHNDFRSYHKEKTKDGLLLNKPAKGQRSHLIDATRYVASTLEFKYGAVQIPHKAIDEKSLDFGSLLVA